MAQHRLKQKQIDQLSKRDVLDHYFNLQASLARMSISKAGSELQDETSSGSIMTAKDDLVAIGKFISSYVEPVYYNERRKPDSTTAAKVLLLPELLEMILVYTSFTDILHMSEACQTMRTIIYGSSLLQTRLFLKPAKQPAPAQTPFDGGLYNFRGYSIDFDLDFDYDSDDSSNYAPDWGVFSTETCSYIRIEKAKPEIDLPKIGGSWKNMILCHPPIKYVKTRRTCSKCAYTKKSKRVITSDTGFTLASLLKRAKKQMKLECKRCNAFNWESRGEHGQEATKEGKDLHASKRKTYDHVTFEAYFKKP